MAKGQKKSTREIRKPKAVKVKSVAIGPFDRDKPVLPTKTKS